MFLPDRKPPDLEPERLQALQPYLEKLRRWNASTEPGSTNPEQPARIRVGDRSVALGTWERTSVREALSENPAAGSWLQLVAQGVALLTKCMVDIDAMRRDQHRPLESLYRLQAELMLDTAIGMALLREVQDTIDALVNLGNVEQAKRLSEFRHKIGHMVNDVRKLLSESERAKAETLSEELATRPDPDRADAESPLERLTREIDAQARSDEDAGASARDESGSPHARPSPGTGTEPPGLPDMQPGRGPLRLPTSTELLALAFVLITSVWVVAVHLPTLFSRQPSPLTRQSTSRPELFRRIDPRPPSLFVTMAPGAWEGLDDAGRSAAIEELSQIAAGAGFRGVLLRTDQGRPVAHWLSERGVALLEGGEEADPPRSPAPSGPDSTL